jgi:hypothetical protein
MKPHFLTICLALVAAQMASPVTALAAADDSRPHLETRHGARQLIVDGKEHTVLMMQVENEVGVLGDSRDHIAAANEAFAKPVPKDLMNYLVQHKATLAPELREVWAANGYKTSGTWEEVFGPGRPDSIPPVPAEERDTAWHKSYWLVDEIFMAWRYSMYVNKVAAAGKAEYDIPMYVNTWLQEPSHPRPGEFPSGCPEPEVHDIWRFGAPSIDILAPDLYVQTFAETCERFIRNGNPLFIPETGANASNALVAFLKYNTIGFSPFGIEGRGGAPGTNAPAADALAQTYAILDYLAPVILENQGRGTIVMLQPMSVTFTPNTPERGGVVLGSFDETLRADGRWVAGRRLNGDETRNNTRWPSMASFGVYRYTVFQRQ